MREPPVIPAEIEALLWAEREQRAAEWVDPYEVDPDAVELAALEALLTPTLVPATEADLLHREHLVGQWEHAVSQVARWEAVKQRVLAESLDYALADGTQGATRICGCGRWRPNWPGLSGCRIAPSPGIWPMPPSCGTGSRPRSRCSPPAGSPAPK